MVSKDELLDAVWKDTFESRYISSVSVRPAGDKHYRLALDVDQRAMSLVSWQAGPLAPSVASPATFHGGGPMNASRGTDANASNSRGS